MSSAAALLPLPVILPLFGAGLALALGRSALAQRVVSFVVLAITVTVAVALLVMTHADDPLVMHVGGWPAEIGISLLADRLSALMLLVSTIVAMCVLVYSLGQGVHEYGRDTPLSVYHPTFLVLVAGVSNAFLSGDLFNIYVGFEVLLVASYVLLTLGGTAPRIRAGTVYVIVSLLSSIIFLVGIALVYAATGTVNLAQLSNRLSDLPDDVSLALQLMLLIGFAIKAAVFPLSAWLPDSYPTAPAPVTAVFAGLLTKVGVYAIIRLQTLLFPDSSLGGLLMWVALFTMVFGILGAVAQSDIKRMLSFTLVSHIGYMLFGIALATDAGLSASIFYVAHHITIQTTLFLVAGLIDKVGGSTALDELGGLAQRAPLIAILFFVPAMNLSGIPPFSGFFGKLGLIQAGVDDGSWMAYTLVVGAILVTILTLYTMAKAWDRAFWRSGARSDQPSPAEADGTPVPDSPPPGRDTTDLHGKPVQDQTSKARPRLATVKVAKLAMIVPAIVLVLLSTGLTLLAGPLYDLTDSAARELHERTPYIEAVLGEAAADG